MFIYANQTSQIISRLFSLSIYVFIGKISYSLYLWHWVVLVMIRYCISENNLSLSYIILALILTFVLSVITYYGVEQPIRKKGYSFLKSIIVLYFLPAILVLSVAFVSININKIPEELKYPENICHNTLDFSCLKGDLTKTPEILFIGTSHTGQLNPFVDEIGKKEGWSADVVSISGIQFAFGYFHNKDDILEKQRNQWVYQNYHKYKVIVLTNYIKDLRDPEIDVFEKTIERFLAEGKTVYLIDMYKLADKDPLRYFYQKKLNIALEGARPSVRKIKENPMIGIAKKYPQIRYIDLKKYIPNDFMLNGKPIMKDKVHLNVYGAKYLAHEFLKEEVFYKK